MLTGKTGESTMLELNTEDHAKAVSAIEALIHSYEENPASWIRGSNFKYERDTAKIIGYCVNGGIIYFLRNKNSEFPAGCQRYLVSHLDKMAGTFGIVNYNDDSKRTLPEVLTVLKATLATIKTNPQTP